MKGASSADMSGLFFCYFLVILESAFVLVPTQATKLLFVLVFVIRGCLSRQKCGCNFVPKQVPETHCDLHKHHRSCSTPTTSARACAFFGAMKILNRCVLNKSLASDENDIWLHFGRWPKNKRFSTLCVTPGASNFSMKVSK